MCTKILDKEPLVWYNVCMGRERKANITINNCGGFHSGTQEPLTILIVKRTKGNSQILDKEPLVWYNCSRNN